MQSSNAAGIKNASTTRRRRTGQSPATTRAAASGGTLQFGFNDDSGGLEVSPNVVLILTLMYIGIVILLHIWGKFQ